MRASSTPSRDSLAPIGTNEPGADEALRISRRCVMLTAGFACHQSGRRASIPTPWGASNPSVGTLAARPNQYSAIPTKFVG